eukprot:jgi/Mesen1/5405/ME000268S04604
MAEEENYGNACYFYRDLKRGSFGGDVSCLQQYLAQEGHLKEDATGYFGDATEEALIRWQLENELTPAKGFLGYSSRVAYARKHRRPTAEQLRALEHQAEGAQQVCLKVECATRDGLELCQSRCVKKDTSYADRMHLCQDACQQAMSEACDKAFPASQTSNFKHCLRLVAKNCKHNCERTISK